MGKNWQLMRWLSALMLNIIAVRAQAKPWMAMGGELGSGDDVEVLSHNAKLMQSGEGSHYPTSETMTLPITTLSDWQLFWRQHKACPAGAWCPQEPVVDFNREHLLVLLRVVELGDWSLTPRICRLLQDGQGGLYLSTYVDRRSMTGCGGELGSCGETVRARTVMYSIYKVPVIEGPIRWRKINFCMNG